jgi:hypothetical protein
VDLVKVRTWELVLLSCQDTRSKDLPKKPSNDLEVQSLSMSLQRVCELYNKNDYKKFSDETETILEEERLLSDAPIVPQIASLDEVNICKQPLNNVLKIMKTFYSRHSAPEEIIYKFTDF